MKRFLFTSESVTEGHPDKICDKISDKILDIALMLDKNSKMAVETTIKDNFVLIYGEANTSAIIDYENVAKSVLKDIGYTEDFEVLVKVGRQSSEINNAVVKDFICAGDQGIMFGYATNETKEYMPLPILLANRLAQRLTFVRKNNLCSFLKPDGKTSVTVEYVNDVPVRVDTVIIACQHDEDISKEVLDEFIINEVIKKVISSNYIDSNTKFLINTSGSFIIGGPYGDSGTTGRKIVCDTYGGFARVGGGCFSSKDPSKVDRTGAYYARYVAKNIVAHNLADRCEIQVSYAIGMNEAVSLFIETFGTNKVSMKEIYNYVKANFNFSVSNMIKELDLLKPIYYDLSSYGHFGRTDLDLSWERIVN